MIKFLKYSRRINTGAEEAHRLRSSNAWDSVEVQRKSAPYISELFNWQAILAAYAIHLR